MLMTWFKRSNSLADALPVRIGGETFAQVPSTPVRALGLDQAVITVTLALLLWGWVMVYSATIAMSDNPKFEGYNTLHFFVRHAFALVMGVIAARLAFAVPMTWWDRYAPHLFIACLVLLIVVLIPGIGKGVNGAHRWISFKVMNFQPSEFAKLGILLYAANYMVRKMEVKERFFSAVLPMVVALAVIGALLLAEPDMGAFLVITAIAMGILFLGGVNARMFFLAGSVMVAAFSAMVFLSEWRRARIFAYLNPWDEKYSLGKGYQLSHALIAIGRGEIWGVGLGGSVEKLHWLPEAHTDFLLAVIGEEFGLMGILLVLIAFLWLSRRMMSIGRQAIALERVFSGLVAQGVSIWIGFQALINIGVNLGALPTKGLTLPLMSYGGSAIVLNLIAIAIVMRVDYENRLLMRGKSA